MNILIDIGHPAHVHYYRNLDKELKKYGHKTLWTIKDLDIIKKLLEYYGIDYIILPRKSDTIRGKIWKQITYNYLITRICYRNKIDIAIGTSVSIVYASKILKLKSFVFDDDDDDVQPLMTKFVNPFTDFLISPEALKNKRKRKDTIFYPGYHELAYLHPNRFTPDDQVLQEIGITKGEDYFVMRFNVFKAHHDKGALGLSLDQKIELINVLKPFGRIFITTERNIEPELQEFQLKIGPEKIHSLLFFSKMFIGDSQTMTSEAAVLGVPSFRCNSFARSISYLNEQEAKYGLTFAYFPAEFSNMITKIKDLLADPNLKNTWTEKRSRMLSEKIDVTDFWFWIINNFQDKVKLINCLELYSHSK